MASDDIDDEKNGAMTVAAEKMLTDPVVEPVSPGAMPDGDEATAGLRADATSDQPLPSPPEDEPVIEEPPPEPVIEEPPAPRITPRVRTTNYEGFKNHYSEDESCFAIEVLVGWPRHAEDEIMREKLRLGRPGGRRRNLQSSQLPTSKPEATSNEVWIQRVRIQSRFILAHLGKVTGQSWDIDTPRTFYRPFRLFIHWQPKMKAILERLRTTWAPEDGIVPSAEQANDALATAGSDSGGKFPDLVDESSDDERSDDGSSDSGSNAPDDEKNIPRSVLNSHETFKHVECYVNFVDKHIMPLQDMFKGTSRQKVRYSDLWYLFQPGDLVYSPSISERAGANDSATRSSVYQPTWKIMYINPPSIWAKQPDDFDKDHKYYIFCHYIDYDGEKYGPVKYKFEIGPYEGERDIKHLTIYPLRYFADAKSLRKRLPHINQNFESLLNQKHLYCRGWTLTTSPDGSALGKDVMHPEHIDSTIIVDFKAALQSYPDWRTPFDKPSRHDEVWRFGLDDGMPIIQWVDRRRTKIVQSTTEATVREDSVGEKVANRYLKVDPFLVAFKDDKTGNGYKLSDDNTILLPSRVMAYVLRDRKFVQLDSRSLSQIPKQTNVFDNLKINPHHKEMVLALVDSHFHKMNKHSERHILGQDLIQGKGEGLVILLHEVPRGRQNGNCEGRRPAQRPASLCHHMWRLGLHAQGGRKFSRGDLPPRPPLGLHSPA